MTDKMINKLIVEFFEEHGFTPDSVELVLKGNYGSMQVVHRVAVY